jgi:hypothetical protein
MLQEGRAAFAILNRCVARLPGHPEGRAAELDALFVWALVHGLAGVLGTDAIATLGLPERLPDELERHAGSRLRSALSGPPPGR